MEHEVNKNFDEQLFEAARTGNDEEVRRLIPLSNTKNNEALNAAIHHHHAACVELLLPVSDLSDPDEINSMLLWAVESIDLASVKLLIPVCNPKRNKSYPLQVAVLRDYTDIVNVLFDASEPREALENLQKSFPKGHNRGGGVIEDRVAQFQKRVERFESEQQREVLTTEINSDNNPVKNKQKM